MSAKTTLISLNDPSLSPSQRKQQLIVTAGVAGGVLALSTQQPANADVVTDLTTMVASLDTITTAVVPVAISVLTVRLAFKIINRLTVKG